MRLRITRRQMANWLNRPEYVHQPGKLLRRVFGKASGEEGEAVIELPWKLQLEVDTSETSGRILSHHGIFEMPVVEALFRLVDPLDTVLDVGANIGYMTAVAASTGAAKVISFEPHPALYPRLSRNIERWKAIPALAGRVEGRAQAVSSACGTSILNIPRGWCTDNQMLATLEEQPNPEAFDEVRVPVTTLDEVIREAGGPIGVLKIDIEGHEFQAFKGARESLSQRKIRDIIYEDFAGIGSDPSKLLASHGYFIFGVKSSLLGPVLIDDRHLGKPAYGEHNFVATIDPARVKKRMSARGYLCLSRGARTGLQERLQGQACGEG